MSVSMGVYLGMKLLGHRVCENSDLLDIIRLFHSSSKKV